MKPPRGWIRYFGQIVSRNEYPGLTEVVTRLLSDETQAERDARMKEK